MLSDEEEDNLTLSNKKWWPDSDNGVKDAWRIHEHDGNCEPGCGQSPGPKKGIDFTAVAVVLMVITFIGKALYDLFKE